MNVIKIDKNIPLPKVTHANRRSHFHFLKSLEVGDSFIVNGNTPNLNPKSAMTACYSLAKKYRDLSVRGDKDGKVVSDYQLRNFRISIRTQEGTSLKPKSVRIWRVR